MFCSIYFNTKLDKSAIAVPKARISVYDAENARMENLQLYKYIPYEDISQNVVNAFVALEDKRFFKHNGVDYYRIAGALVNDIKAGSFKEGGSTITQQLAKNTQLGNEKTLKRKIKEMRLATEIEKNYSKEEILEMYLNAIYFGNGIYGIDSACRNYFNKSPSELSVSESAILAGIVKNPAKYSPTVNTDAAIERRNLVLRLMKEQGYIDAAVYSSSVNEQYTPAECVFDSQICTPYYNSVLEEACGILGITEKTLIQSEYKIYTYYSAEKQNAVFEAFNSKNYESVNKNGSVASYSVLLAGNNSGGVEAYYSNFAESVFSLRRQPGSTAKPIVVYAPCVENGLITEQTPVLDEKISIEGYAPSNYADSYLGWTTAETALSKSINTVAVKLLNDLGVDNALRFAEKCGFSFSQSDRNLAVALGGMTYGETLVELSEAYMSLACGGLHKDNTFVSKIVDPNGKTVYTNSQRTERVMSRDTAFLVTDMLMQTVKSGTASKLNGFGFDLAAKTGTAQSTKCDENLDAWNISYTTEDTLCVWYGDTKNTAETAIETTGSSYPTLLARYVRASVEAPKAKSFDIPDTVFETEIDTYALEKDHEVYLSNYNTPPEFRQKAYFSFKNCPTASSPYFTLEDIVFDVSEKDGLLQTQIYTDSPYNFILVKKDLLSGKTEEYQCVADKLNVFESGKRNGIYSYYLEAYYGNQFLGNTSDRIIFT
jgi:membrane peptidoglycan carboxypeptidase